MHRILLSLVLAISVTSLGCAAEVGTDLDDETRAVEDAPLVAEGVLVLSGTSGPGAVGAATACLFSGWCVAGVVIAVVAMGGWTYWVFEADNPSEVTAWPSGNVELSIGSERVNTTSDGEAVGPLAHYLRQGVTFGDQPIPMVGYIIATRYVDYCQGPAVQGGGACVLQARQYLSCLSFGGGQACYNEFSSAIARSFSATIVAIPGASGSVGEDLQRLRDSENGRDFYTEIGRNGGHRSGCVHTVVETPQGLIPSDPGGYLRFIGRGRFRSTAEAPKAWFESLVRSFGLCAAWHIKNQTPLWNAQYCGWFGQVGPLPIGDPFHAADALALCQLQQTFISDASECDDVTDLPIAP